MNSAQHLLDTATKAVLTAVEALGGEILTVEVKKEGVTVSVVAVVYDNPVLAEKLKVFMDGLVDADEELVREALTFTTGRI